MYLFLTTSYKKEMTEQKVENSIEIDFEIKDGVLKKYIGTEKKVTIPNGIKKIAWNAFKKEMQIEAIFIPKGVSEIPEDAFFECKTLKKVSLPSTLLKIGNQAFWFCENLEEIIIPPSVETIGTEAFYECTSLKKVYISDSIQKIGKNTFFLWGVYLEEDENWFVRDWEINVDCSSNNEASQKQIIAALRYENLAYTFLHNKLFAEDEFIAQIIKWLGAKGKRKVIVDTAIRLDDDQLIENLFQLNIKISKSELNSYIETAKSADRAKIADVLSEYILKK